MSRRLWYMVALGALSRGRHPQRPLRSVTRRLLAYFDTHPSALRHVLGYTGLTPAELVQHCRSTLDRRWACAQLVEASAYAYAFSGDSRLFALVGRVVDSVVNIEGIVPDGSDYKRDIVRNLTELTERHPELFPSD